MMAEVGLESSQIKFLMKDIFLWKGKCRFEPKEEEKIQNFKKMEPLLLVKLDWIHSKWNQ